MWENMWEKYRSAEFAQFRLQLPRQKHNQNNNKNKAISIHCSSTLLSVDLSANVIYC